MPRDTSKYQAGAVGLGGFSMGLERQRREGDADSDPRHTDTWDSLYLGPVLDTDKGQSLSGARPGHTDRGQSPPGAGGSSSR